MTLFKCKIVDILVGVIFLSASVLLPHQVLAVTECDCSSDAASPPFLAAGASPNLLLLIDNSASMLDMGYIDDTKESWECFDNTFDNTESYTGYFDNTKWYQYDNSVYAGDVAAGITTNAGRFVPFSAVLPGAAQNVGGTLYTSADMVVEMWENPATVWNVDLYTTGKILNWATASKLDVEKKILTGGKYDETREVWTSEARGCAGYRFIKEISLVSGGTNYKLTMGILAGDNDITQLEIFKISEDGYDNYGDCATAVEEVLFGTGNPQNAVGNCIDPDNDADNSEKQVLIHSTTDCWKYWKGDLNNWPQHTTTLLDKCGDVYASGVDPREISPSDPSYACYGDSIAGTDYIGRCWTVGTVCPEVVCADDNDPAVPEQSGGSPYYRCNTNIVQYCPKSNYKKGACNVAWRVYYAPGTCPEDAGAGWVGGYSGVGVIPAVLETCVEDAMIAYCQGIQAPQVVDPSDLVVNPTNSATSVGDVYNLPAILTDAGVVGGLGEPIAKMNGLIQKDAATSVPEGLLQKYASQIRIGAMAFNNDGSYSECDATLFDPYVTYNCDDDDNEDGTYLVQEMGGNTADLIVNINDIKADSWTPLAEAMFNAIGYFT
ncbi:MAG: hypothetical protein HOG03_05125 [Desulfobacula sp.]|jgi:type IV pilus assembly protein PilY1|uniref:hypothetical protein n=1 Tax=Desulfobacula sp. TaxID=2593537 RepID=UPI001D36F2DE|nr:hypothetical protein [Desulfobacula sp.]MBT3484595.1 hypothetical protein [Desulfobacula sp.]MBT3803965.1 hypothetical protein [Desulfobacula sp.]MBT4023580.1 hypothetical protein [Desulfobacula sp.]MBT4197752.1 hypothetical protein [Desulfobacula sp.]